MPRMTQRYATITMNNDSKRCIILTIYTCSSTKLDPVTWLKKKKLHVFVPTGFVITVQIPVAVQEMWYLHLIASFESLRRGYSND